MVTDLSPAETASPFATIEEAIEDIRSGKFVVVCDDADRENEGDLTIAAQFVTPESIAFMATHGRGLICLCLTVAGLDGEKLAFHAVRETIARTTLGELEPGQHVNVEPALRAGDELGGHYVQGHVDGVGRIQSVEAEGEGLRVFVEAPDDILRFCVEKGSVTLDGVSLTVAELAADAFAVALVPHTLAATTLSDLAPGQRVNLEADVLAKYVERLISR